MRDYDFHWGADRDHLEQRRQEVENRMTVRNLIDYLKQFEKDTLVYLTSDDAPDVGEYLVLDTIPLADD